MIKNNETKLEGIEDIIVEDMVKKYPVSRLEAKQIAKCVIQKTPKFLKLINQKDIKIENILRTGIFRNIQKKSLQLCYYRLRQYKKESKDWEILLEDLKKAISQNSKDKIRKIAEEISKSHMSTEERIAENIQFYNKIIEIVGQPKSILDIGCGANPLIFPFQKFKKLNFYLALDNDKKIIDILSVFNSTIQNVELIPMIWDLKEGWDKIKKFDNFDLALMMKLVPVVLRQERELAEVLAKTPAKKWVITGSKFSLVKKEKIELREKKIITNFIKKSNKRILDSFSLKNEFAFVVGD
jgi:16S rRNA (guanine(1405)-N(7))-methyltransferase